MCCIRRGIMCCIAFFYLPLFMLLLLLLLLFKSLSYFSLLLKLHTLVHNRIKKWMGMWCVVVGNVVFLFLVLVLFYYYSLVIILGLFF